MATVGFSSRTFPGQRFKSARAAAYCVCPTQSPCSQRYPGRCMCSLFVLLCYPRTLSNHRPPNPTSFAPSLYLVSVRRGYCLLSNLAVARARIRLILVVQRRRDARRRRMPCPFSLDNHQFLAGVPERGLGREERCGQKRGRWRWESGHGLALFYKGPRKSP
jgi:hypothetical protein